MSELLDRLWNCRLCWTLTRYVFVLILAIESIILIPSTYNFRANALTALEEKAMVAIHAVLPGPMDRDGNDLKQRLSRLQDFGYIKGLDLVAMDGDRITVFGEPPYAGLAMDTSALRAGKAVLSTSAMGGSRHDMVLATQSAGEPVTVLLRLDSSHINAALAAFIVRIAGLIAIIVLFVTAGTMFVVDRLVLTPILQLRQSMYGAAADPDHAESHRVEADAPGEMGEVLAAHNTMLTEIAIRRQFDQARAEERTRFLERHDLLTGLPNRAHLLEYLHRLLADAERGGAVIHGLVLDFADFRLINDAHGTDVGDQVLINVAKKLDALAGTELFVARLGADEFAIADAKSAGPIQAAELAERILAICDSPLQIDGVSLHLRGRVGIACTSAAAGDAEHLLHDAQLALNLIRKDTDQQARYRFFAEDMTLLIRQRQEIERDLREALDHDQLRLFYQPKVTLNQNGPGNAFSSCEALIRWQHPTKGWLSPADFIPVAEECGLIFPLGEWVLREACKQIRSWREAGYVVPRVAVNIAARQFQDANLPELVCHIIKSTGVDADDLELEITETAAMSDVQASIAVLGQLRRIGVKLSIDDFGTGYSSLSYLQQLEVDSIKIDKSFVDDIGSGRNGEAVCDAIIQLGQSLGMKIIAEGVENNAQLDFLRQRHCDEVQGYLYARPMSAVDLSARLEYVGTREALPRELMAGYV